MKFSESIRYAGLLIPATDCDHSSYLKLGLICPECKQPVHIVNEKLRKSFQRKSKKGITSTVKEHKVDKYFAHFQSTDDNEVKQCENRVANYGQSHLNKINSQSRNQRYQLFVDNLKYFIGTNQRINYFELFLIGAREDFYQTCNPKKREIELEKYLRKEVAYIRSHSAKVCQVIDSMLKQFDQVSSYKNLAYLQQEIELKLHNKICQEIAQFLLSPKNYKILADWFLVNKYISLILIHHATKVSSKNTLQKKLAFIYNKSLFSSLEDTIGLDNFFNSFKIQSHFAVHFQATERRPDDIVYKTSMNMTLGLLASTIALTPWADNFELIREGKNQLNSTIRGFLIISNSQIKKSEDINIQPFIPLNHSYQKRFKPNLSKLEFNRTVRANLIYSDNNYSFDYHVKKFQDNNSQKRIQFNIVIYHESNSIATGGGIYNLPPSQIKSIKKSYRNLSKIQLDTILNNPTFYVLQCQNQEAYSALIRVANDLFLYLI